MRLTRSFRALGPIDLRGVLRDPLLRWMIFFPLVVALAVRWGIPFAADIVRSSYQFDLLPFYPLLMAFVLLMTPMLAGMVIGFLLLDQKDDQTLAALQATPLMLNGYLTYRMVVPMLLSFLLTLILYLIANLITISLTTLLLTALLAAPLAPFYALVLAGLASNKVQGFAIAKGLGVMLLAPFAVYFVEPPLQWLVGIIPLYWPSKFMLEEIRGEGVGWLVFSVGFIYQMVLMAVLIRRFNTVMQR